MTYQPNATYGTGGNLEARTQQIDLDATMEAMNGMTYTDDGIAGHIKTSRSRYGSWVVGHEPSAAGKRSARYCQIRRELGDDWSTDYTETPAAVWDKAEAEGRIKYAFYCP